MDWDNVKYKSCVKEYVKKITTSDNSAEFVVEQYDEFCRAFSCRPDEDTFPKYKVGDVIDEDKSVKWNREEVEKRILAREEEVKRLNRLKAELSKMYEEGIIKLIAKENKLKIKEVELLWNYFYREQHSYGVENVYNYLNEFIVSTYLDIKNLNK